MAAVLSVCLGATPWIFIVVGILVEEAWCVVKAWSFYRANAINGGGEMYTYPINGAPFTCCFLLRLPSCQVLLRAESVVLLSTSVVTR